MKISEDSKGYRLGEGAIGLALWQWQRSNLDQIYVTVYSKHESLINILESFGFISGGNKGEEKVYYKDKKKISYETPKKSFPYIDPSFTRGKYLPINDDYHDQMFQYSELGRTFQQDAVMAASNGFTKIYVATPNSTLSYISGDIVFVYRKHPGECGRTYKSVVTSYCTLIDCTSIKVNGKEIMSLGEFIKDVGNKTVLDEDELSKYYQRRNVYTLTLLYNGFFGKGKNVNHFKLKEQGMFESHPYNIVLDREQVFKIMKMGGKNENDIIINKSRTCGQYSERNEKV